MSSSIPLTPDPASEPVMLSPEEVVRQLRALRAQMPADVSTLPRSASRVRLAHVDADFIQAAINAVGISDVVQRALGRSDEELRQEIDAAARWTAVVDELRALLRSAVAGNIVRRQRIGLAALQTYKICQQLARDEGNARLSTHINEMKRLNKFGRSRRKPAAEPAPAPQPNVQ
jgi:hypothetical protein